MIVYKSEGKKINEQRKVNRVWSYFFFILNAGHYCLSIFSHFHSISRLLTTELDNVERARSTLIHLDTSFTLSPWYSSSPSSMLGKLDYSLSMVNEDWAWVDFELGINILSTVSRGRLLIQLGWHVELDEPLLSSVAHITKLIQLSYNC